MIPSAFNVGALGVEPFGRTTFCEAVEFNSDLELKADAIRALPISHSLRGLDIVSPYHPKG